MEKFNLFLSLPVSNITAIEKERISRMAERIEELLWSMKIYNPYKDELAENILPRKMYSHYQEQANNSQLIVSMLPLVKDYARNQQPEIQNIHQPKIILLPGAINNFEMKKLDLPGEKIIISLKHSNAKTWHWTNPPKEFIDWRHLDSSKQAVQLAGLINRQLH